MCLGVSFFNINEVLLLIKKMCIMLLQRLEREIEVANLQHRKDAAHRKAVSKNKGNRELRNLISSVNYDGR